MAQWPQEEQYTAPTLHSTTKLDVVSMPSTGTQDKQGNKPQTCELCSSIPPPALPAHCAAGFPSLVKTPTIPFLGLIPPVLGRDGGPFPSPAGVGLSRGAACRIAALQMAFPDSLSSGCSLPQQLLPRWRGPHSAGAWLLSQPSQEHTSAWPARRYYWAGWALLSLLLPERSP